MKLRIIHPPGWSEPHWQIVSLPNDQDARADVFRVFGEYAWLRATSAGIIPAARAEWTEAEAAEYLATGKVPERELVWLQTPGWGMYTEQNSGVRSQFVNRKKCLRWTIRIDELAVYSSQIKENGRYDRIGQVLLPSWHWQRPEGLLPSEVLEYLEGGWMAGLGNKRNHHD